jgi:hypothetical protein
VLVESWPYSRHVCSGAWQAAVDRDEHLGGLAGTCTIQFTAAQMITNRTVPTII